MRTTSSSTSSSEPGGSGASPLARLRAAAERLRLELFSDEPPAPAREGPGGAEAPARWRAFALVFAAALFTVYLVLLGITAALDPYDTGRLALVEKRGIPPTGPRIANASRGRDPAFNAAIIGNSRIQMVEPSRLDAITGLDFVTLMVPAVHPEEKFALLDWFMRSHAKPSALVFGLDEWWCRQNIAPDKPFPFWLYARDLPTYIGGLARFETLERVPGRIAYLLDKGAERARPDGFWDYEPDYHLIGATEEKLLRLRLSAPRPVESENPDNKFPAAAILAGHLAQLPASTRVVFAWGPVHASYNPVEASPADATQKACRATYQRMADARPRTGVVDWSGERPENAQMENFFDRTHYRKGLGQQFADAIGRELVALDQPSSR